MTLEDAARPPALAHQRFETDRASFVSLGLAARFERIHRTNLWGAASSVSGLGSEENATIAIRTVLPALLRDLGIRSLLDAPCGDARWIPEVCSFMDYIGVDIMPALIAASADRVNRGEISGRFIEADITRDDLPAADAILCRDCLVHLSFENIGRTLSRFRATGATWLIATTFPDWRSNTDCEDGDWRALNLCHAPFHWPTPAAMLNENCREGDGGWRDKSLGLWRLADLPIPTSL